MLERGILSTCNSPVGAHTKKSQKKVLLQWVAAGIASNMGTVLQHTDATII